VPAARLCRVIEQLDQGKALEAEFAQWPRGGHCGNMRGLRPQRFDFCGRVRRLGLVDEKGDERCRSECNCAQQRHQKIQSPRHPQHPQSSRRNSGCRMWRADDAMVRRMTAALLRRVLQQREADQVDRPAQPYDASSSSRYWMSERRSFVLAEVLRQLVSSLLRTASASH